MGHVPALVPRAGEGHLALDTGGGAIARLWATALATAVSLAAALLKAAPLLPWPALVIGAGAMLLFAPLILRPFPDAFVNGRRALLIFSAGTAAFAALLWLT